MSMICDVGHSFITDRANKKKRLTKTHQKEANNSFHPFYKRHETTSFFLK